MHLNCPECSSTIVSDDVNLVKTIAKCKDCNNIFEFTDQLEKALPPLPFGEEIVMPPGIEVLRLMSELEIMVKWRASASYFTFFFALFWNAFIAIVGVIAIVSGGLIPMLFMIPFFLVGVYLIYSSIGYLVNTTYITVNENRLSIEHRPINFLIQSDKY